MNTTLDFYPATNGTGEANGENGNFPILDYSESAFSQRCEASTLADVNSEELLRELLRRIGEDPDREGLRQTPARIIRSWHELFSGYNKRADDVLVTHFMPNSTTKLCFCAMSNSTLPASIICCHFVARPTAPTFPTKKL